MTLIVNNYFTMTTGRLETTNSVRNAAEAKDDASNASLDVAIVGGGIIGVVIALGLLQRGFRVTIYEKADDFHEMGAGSKLTTLPCIALSSQVVEKV